MCALDKVNVGDWFGKRLAKLVGAERTLVQKSGYFARSAAANEDDRKLIREMAHVAVECGLAGTPGLIGHDEERGGALRADRVAARSRAASPSMSRRHGSRTCFGASASRWASASRSRMAAKTEAEHGAGMLGRATPKGAETLAAKEQAMTLHARASAK